MKQARELKTLKELHIFCHDYPACEENCKDPIHQVICIMTLKEEAQKWVEHFRNAKYEGGRDLKFRKKVLEEWKTLADWIDMFFNLKNKKVEK